MFSHVISVIVQLNYAMFHFFMNNANVLIFFFSNSVPNAVFEESTSYKSWIMW